MPLPTNKILKQFLTLFLVAITFMAFQVQCMEEKKQGNLSHKVFQFSLLPEALIKRQVLKYTAVDLLDDGELDKLSAVCKEWSSLFEQHKMHILTFAICEKFSVDQETCERFLNGRLIYKPDPNSDCGKVDLRISDLENPLEGTFDLSKCGDAGKYLSISTGYRKEKKAENKDKLEIWFTPRFLVEKEINGSANHFKAIFPSKWPETASVGIIWTWGSWDDMGWYDYLTNQDFEQVSVGNLYERWLTSTPQTRRHHFPKLAARRAWLDHLLFRA